MIPSKTLFTISFSFTGFPLTDEVIIVVLTFVVSLITCVIILLTVENCCSCRDSISSSSPEFDFRRWRQEPQRQSSTLYYDTVRPTEPARPQLPIPETDLKDSGMTSKTAESVHDYDTPNPQLTEEEIVAALVKEKFHPRVPGTWV